MNILKQLIVMLYIGMINKALLLISIVLIIVLSGCEKQDTRINEGELVIESFYMNQNNIKVLDTLLSYRFYQNTPYNKFRDFIIEKNNLVGKFNTKELVNAKLSINEYLMFEYKVSYDRKTWNETFRLEKENGVFKIVNYNIKEN